MGQACQLPVVSRDDELDADPSRRLIKSELKRSTAESLMEIPGADVVIIDDKGEEVPVESGTFRFVKLAEPSKLVVFFVGDSFEDLSAHGFYYPVLSQTPVCLSNRKATTDHTGSHVLTMTAGDGDVFGIRLPDPLAEGDTGEQLQVLIELLHRYSTFQIAEEPDFADKVAGHILHGGRRVIGGVEWATEKLSENIAWGGELARSKVGKAEEDVKVGPSTTIALAGAKFVTGGTVAVATAVTDGLMDTAVMLGEEIKKAMHKEGGNQEEVKEGQFMRVSKAAGAVSLEMFESLTKAGDRLLDEACNETATVVGQRYGQDARAVAREGLSIAKDVKEMSDMLGKGAAKRLAAKGAMYTAKGLIDGQPIKQSSSASLSSKLTAAQLRQSNSSSSKAWW